ncbi:MAG: PEP-utilizing enzyme [Parcubacteria group bacterium]
MHKLNTPLSVSSYLTGSLMGRKQFGYPLHLSASWYDRGDIYFDKEEIEIIGDFLRYKIKTNPAYPDKIAESIFSLSKNIDGMELPNILERELPELIKLFRKHQELYSEMLGFMSYRGSVQMADILQKEIQIILSYRLAKKKKMNDFKKYAEIISYPYYESVVLEEKKFALGLSEGFGKLLVSQQNEKIEEYLARYEWLAFHWFVGSPPQPKQIKKRFLTLSPTAERELKTIRNDKKLAERKMKNIIHSLSLNSTEKRIIRQYRTWLFLRTFVKDNLNKAGYKLLPILYEIAERIKIERSSMPFLIIEEIDTIDKLPREEIIQHAEERKKGFSAGITEDIFKFRPFEKQSPLTNNENTQEITGSVAYRGIVRGVAKVILSPKDQSNLKKGEILVTSMTTPDFLPAMERAAAFVTDEGGITCHAAIVAREMKKPCIIGTKMATKQLISGDAIEVDAVNGIVKIIKK